MQSNFKGTWTNDAARKRSLKTLLLILGDLSDCFAPSAYLLTDGLQKSMHLKLEILQGHCVVQTDKYSAICDPITAVAAMATAWWNVRFIIKPVMKPV